MTHYLLAVQTEPVVGREVEFNAWYDSTHLPEMLTIDGLVSARRFVIVPSPSGPSPERPYLALYEVETADLAATLTALSLATQKMDMSSAMVANSIAFVYSDV